MDNNLPKIIANELVDNFDGNSYIFQNKENLWYGNIKIVTQPLSELSIDENCGHVKKSSVPLKIIFSPENIIIEIDNEMHIYDYASLRKFSKTPDGKYAQLWFKDINDIYNDFVYDIEYTQELVLIIKGICVFGSHFIDIDDFNAWHRKDFKELYQ